MKYRIEITAGAEQDIESDYLYIVQRAPQAARRWKRFGLAPESGSFPYEVRQLLYGRRRNHGILYTIRTDYVAILSIRHAARDVFRPEDL